MEAMITLFNRLHPFIRYISLGTISVSIQYTLLTLFVEICHIYPTIASAMSFVISSSCNYMMQYHWNFKATGKHYHVFPRYVMVTMTTVTLNVCLFWMLNVPLGIWYLYAQTMALVVVVPINFLINRNFTFAN